MGRGPGMAAPRVPAAASEKATQRNSRFTRDAIGTARGHCKRQHECDEEGSEGSEPAARLASCSSSRR